MIASVGFADKFRQEQGGDIGLATGQRYAASGIDISHSVYAPQTNNLG